MELRGYAIIEKRFSLLFFFILQIHVFRMNEGKYLQRNSTDGNENLWTYLLLFSFSITLPLTPPPLRTMIPQNPMSNLLTIQASYKHLRQSEIAIHTLTLKNIYYKKIPNSNNNYQSLEKVQKYNIFIRRNSGYDKIIQKYLL